MTVTMSAILIMLSVVTAVVLLNYLRPTSGRLPYPPGPPGEFVIGHLRTIPKTFAWKTFAEWGRKHGPINRISVAGMSIVILNSYDAVVDLLEKRSTIYSDKPPYVLANKVYGFHWHTALMSTGPTHKKHRALLAQALQPRHVQQDCYPLLEQCSHRIALDLIDEPDNFKANIRRSIGNVIQTVTYGASRDGALDLTPVVEAISKLFIKSVMFSNHAVEFFPWLTALPERLMGSRFALEAVAARRATEAALRLPFEMVKRKKDAGEFQRNSLVLSLLKAQELNGGSGEDEYIASAAATLHQAGAETTSLTFLSFLLAMVLHPEFQNRAQEELDRVIGDRLPTAADKGSLPFLDAILMETIRWHPVVPLGGGRKTKEDDVYNGYLIPAGTVVLGNVWGILHDEQRFPEPSMFNPDRWMLALGKPPLDGGEKRDFEDQGLIDPFSVAFVKIQKKIDPVTRQSVEVEAKWTGDAISGPEPFACDFKPRSRERMERIKEAVSSAQELSSAV